MANITEDHLRHMARRHHATMQKLEGMRERFAGITTRFVSTIEVGAGSWLGGALEGRTGGKSLGPVPYNLGAGLVLLIAGHAIDKPDAPQAGQFGTYVRRTASNAEHLNNLGNGFIGSYLAATGYSWGKKWKETGKLFGHHSWSQAYEQGPSGPQPPMPPPTGVPGAPAHPTVPPPPTSGWYQG